MEIQDVARESTPYAGLFLGGLFAGRGLRIWDRTNRATIMSLQEEVEELRKDFKQTRHELRFLRGKHEVQVLKTNIAFRKLAENGIQLTEEENERILLAELASGPKE